MRLLFLILVLSGLAHADEKVAREDEFLRQNADLDVQRAKAELSAALARQEMIITKLMMKYHLADGEGWDSQTLVIKRKGKK